MKTSLQRISLALGSVALLCALSAAPAVAAPTVSLGGPASVAPGQSFQLGVSASGFSDLYAYQFDISFDPALFKAIGAVQGSFLSTAGSSFFDGGSIDNVAGTISFIFESLIGPGAGAVGDGELLQLTFEAIGPVNTAGNFSINSFSALDSSLAAIDVALVGRAVAIPEPSVLATALLAVGMLLATRTGVTAIPRRHRLSTRDAASAT